MTSRGRKKLLPKEKTCVDGFQVPKNVGTLNRFFNDSPNIHELGNEYLASGSNITEKQYVALRIICPDIILPKRLKKYLVTFGLNSVWENAEKLVNESEEFGVFLRLVGNNQAVSTIYEKSADYPGSLKPAKRVLEQIKPVVIQTQQASPPETRSTIPRISASGPSQPSRFVKPTFKDRLGTFTRRKGKEVSESRNQGYQFGAEESADPAYPEGNEEANDEITPNTAIILLLQGITDLAKNPRIEWAFDHIKLRADFRSGYFNAWTDGALRQISRRNILAIVEAKKHRRRSHTKEIIMQEGAESACWVLGDDNELPRLNGHRVLISQDYNETWVTFRSYSDNYVTYLKKGENQGQVANDLDSHMTMRTVGPFISDFDRDMWSLAVLITAIILRC